MKKQIALTKMAFLKDLRLQSLFIVAIVFAFYGRTLQYGFIWDDFNYIVNSTVLGHGTNFFDLWTKKVTVDFWPVTYSVLWILKYFFGSDPVAYHLANTLLFTLSCVLLFLVLHRLKVKYAFFLTLLFCIHPMNVSVVSWVFQIKTNLANIFGLFSAIQFIKFMEKRNLNSYFLSLLFLMISFLAKISLVMLPFIYLLSMGLSTVPFFNRKTLVLIPFFALSLLFGLANIYWEVGLGFVPVPPSEMILQNSFLVRMLVMGQNYLFYFVESYLPLQLMFVHPKIEPNPSDFQSYLPLLILFICLLASLILVFVRKFKKIPAAAIGFLVAFAILFPVSGLFEIYFMRFSYVAEHYLTIALVGFLIPAVLSLADKFWGKALLGIYVLFLSYQTLSYTPEYRSEKSVFETNLQKNPQDLLSHNLLGLIYKNENNYPLALQHYNKAIEIHPVAAAYYNKAVVLEKLNQLDAARESYEKSIELNPYISNSYMNLGVIYLKLKNLKAALDYFNQALERSPNDPRIYYNVGYAYEVNNDKNRARDWYKKALALAPNEKLFQEAVQNVSH